jgi:prepilin-type N-terminal cleavage/methylation domain-containing protein
MMSFLLPPAHPLPMAPRPRGRRGFSLVELLAVLFILGIMFVVGGREISRAWKRQKLQSASTDIRVLFQRALSEMQRQNMRTFIQVGPAVPPGAPVPGQYLPIYLIGDANGNGAIDAFANPPNPDLLIGEYDIIVKGLSGTKGTTGVDQEFCLSELDPTQVNSTLWSYNLTDWNKPRAIMCDFQGRAIALATGAQLAAPATLVLTHVGVVNGSLMPPTRYLITINPVWSVRVMKQINATPSDSTKWVTQNG